MKRKPIKDDLVKADSEEMDEAEEEAKKEEENEKSCAAKKSEDITEDDLMKSVQQLEAYAKADDPEARKQELLTKAQITDLTDEENSELFKALGNGDTEEIDAEDVAKGLEENEDIQKSLDVSAFLSAQHAELVKALNGMGESLEQSDTRQHEFNLILAKSVATVGKLIKSMGDRVGAMENEPVRKPKSIKPLNKSFAGAQPTDNQLSKSVILNHMEAIAIGEGIPGVDMTNAVARYESTNQIDPVVMNEIAKRTSGAIN